MFVECFVFDEIVLVVIFVYFDYDEVVMLLCVGIIVWNVLFVDGGLELGVIVVLFGIGGVLIVVL